MSKFELDGGTVSVNWTPKAPGYQAKAGRKRVGSVWRCSNGWWAQSEFHEAFTGPFKSEDEARDEVETRFLTFLNSMSESNRPSYGFKPNQHPKMRRSA